MKKWGKLLTLTGGAQVIIQGVGFLCGIIIIRWLSTEQYAYYTLLNTMLGAMTNLADGGISTGVMSESGKVWKNKNKLGGVLTTGLMLRRKFAVGSLAVSLPILFYLLNDQGLPWWQAGLLILCLGPAFWAALSGSLYSVVPKIHQDIDELLKINVSINLIRLLITVPVLLVFPLAGAAILGAGFSQVAGNFKLRKLSHQKADLKAPYDPVVEKSILKTVKKILPGTIYYCISGQIVVWLVAFFGSTESLAQIGALSRLVMLITMIKIIVNMLIVPRYARLPNNNRLIISRFFQVMVLLFVISALLVMFAYLFPEICLWILGKNYANLEFELVLMVISSCLSMLSGIAYAMTSNRAIIPNPYLIIGTTIFVQIIALAFVVDVTTLSGVIYFSIMAAASNLIFRLLHFVYFFSPFHKDDTLQD